MVDPANASDIVFPSGPQDLANFTDGDMGTTATISIPTEAIGIFSGGRNGTSMNFHFSIYLWCCLRNCFSFPYFTAVPVAHILYRNIEQFLPSSTTELK